jgi:hypothetical protein
LNGVQFSGELEKLQDEFHVIVRENSNSQLLQHEGNGPGIIVASEGATLVIGGASAPPNI